jgi:hypothetical protein
MYWNLGNLRYDTAIMDLLTCPFYISKLVVRIYPAHKAILSNPAIRGRVEPAEEKYT